MQSVRSNVLVNTIDVNNIEIIENISKHNLEMVSKSKMKVCQIVATLIVEAY